MLLILNSHSGSKSQLKDKLSGQSTQSPFKGSPQPSHTPFCPYSGPRGPIRGNRWNCLQALDIPEAVEGIEQGPGSFSVLFSTATPGPETPHPSDSHRSVTGPGLWVALPVLGWSGPRLALPRPFHTSRDSSHISPWGGSQDQASRKGRAQNISSVLFKVAPWQAETAAHPTFPNWGTGGGWMGQRTTLGKGPCLYKEGPKVSDPCHHKVCVKVALAFREPH